MRKGLFISVDGPNGAGKTTFIRTLVENLSVNYDVYDTREPSPTSFGTFVKKNEGGLKGCLLYTSHIVTNWAEWWN